MPTGSICSSFSVRAAFCGRAADGALKKRRRIRPEMPPMGRLM